MFSQVDSAGVTSGATAARPPRTVIRQIGRLEPLARSWDVLAGKWGSPIQRFAWVRACAETLADERRLHVLVVGDPSWAAAAAPFVERAERFGRLELLGAEELGEPADILASGADTLAELADGLVRSGRPLFLKRIAADSPVVGAIRRAYRGRGLVICRTSSGSPWIPLNSGRMQPEELLNAGRRSDLRRARRAAEEMGDVRCEVLAPGPSDLEPLLDEAFRVEAASWKGRRGTALTCDTLRGTFFRSYASAATQEGILRLCFLRIGDKSVAMQLAVECAERFWLLKIGYDAEFGRCSPGTLLMVETLRYAMTRGLRAYELLGCPERWTATWTRQAHPCITLRAYPANVRGASALAVDIAQRTRRTVRGQNGSTRV
jgi:CelD/BcsL family acetyltransferase involved in cellulose biosynthesis